MEKKALGKGLQALLPEKKTLAWQVGQEVQEIPIEHIIPNRFQPRKEFGEKELIELSESLKQSGLLQPILVRRTGDGAFELIAGERRWRAAKLAGLTTVPALVRLSNDEKSFVMALVENLQRENLNPMEEARAYRRLSEEFGLTQDQIANAVGKDRSSVANILRLVSLPREVQGFIESGQLTLGHAKILAGVSGADQQLGLARAIVGGGWSVRQTEAKVRNVTENKGRKVHSGRGKRSAFASLEEQIRRKLETKVEIHSRKKGGQIILHFYSSDDLDRITGLILE